MSFTVDIELTNRCNAKCYFCPRDATPHQGLMTQEVFDQSLLRAVEYRDAVAHAIDVSEAFVSLCGLGEPLLHRDAARFVAQVRETPFGCQMSSNGALLDERKARALLDAGLQRIFLNVGERDDAYDDVYKLPWEKTRDNVVRFLDMAGDDCQVVMVLVDHRIDPEHTDEMREYWRSLGVSHFQEFGIINRGGALFVDHMQYEAMPEAGRARELLFAQGEPPLCGAPFGYLFIGYDGLYYLCCSDWIKEAPMGSVFDGSLVEVTRRKLEHVTSREPVCKTCNLDPVNMLTESLNAGDGEEAVAAFVAGSHQQSQAIREALEKIVPGVTADLPTERPKRLIPVTSL